MDLLSNLDFHSTKDSKLSFVLPFLTKHQRSQAAFFGRSSGLHHRRQGQTLNMLQQTAAKPRPRLRRQKRANNNSIGFRDLLKKLLSKGSQNVYSSQAKPKNIRLQQESEQASGTFLPEGGDVTIKFLRDRN